MIKLSFYRVIPIYLLITFISFGCGPGFPIMTAEQERIQTDLEGLKSVTNRLKKETRELRSRVAILKKELAKRDNDKRLDTLESKIKRTKADLGVDINRIREEMALFRGDIDESGHEIELLKKTIVAIRSDVEKELKKRGSASERELLTIREELSDIKKRIKPINERFEKLDEKIASMEKRIKAIGRIKEIKQNPSGFYNRARKLLREKDYDEALAAFKEFIALFPNHNLADNAQYWIGETYYARGDWEHAILEFDVVSKRYPNGDKVPAAILKEGISFNNLGQTKEAVLLLNKVIEYYPQSSEAKIAKDRLKNIEKKKKKKE